ncbi:SLAP domain-containing protein [Schleiferilactobacillus perolens]|uniref:Periplasmic protease n=1 Tax=Schleiferilactobacillus perolens DSM 12744 TaxID=1423792 RepID=A0A0R1N6I9_9LACO|nr:SLAP domain-containing protein [Schleiferilactobacillus perolens]KRL12563.1 periplasmic protease [Schleiferilactobacillus perolens DSM 12744]
MKKASKRLTMAILAILAAAPLLTTIPTAQAATGSSTPTVGVAAFNDVGVVGPNGAAIYTLQNTTAVKDGTLKANSAWRLTGKTTVAGKDYYRVSATQYVLASDVVLRSTWQKLPARYVIGIKHDAPLYNGMGTQKSGRTLNTGSVWIATYTATANGQTWYQIGDNQWVSANDVGELSHSAAHKNSFTVTLVQDMPLWTGFQYKFSGRWLAKGSKWKVTATGSSSNGAQWYQIGANQWINAGGAQRQAVYQNPGQYWQISNTQILPQGKVGYNLRLGSEGIKTWLTLWWLGMDRSYANLNQTAVNKIMYYQRRWGLPVTGQVDVKFWTNMGFKRDDFYTIDGYVSPLKTNENSTRSDHIEAMISTAYQYLGKPYIVGASTSPAYGTDCSGLVMQALYSSGINPLPSSSIRHAQPGYEWESRNLWANPLLKKVSYGERQRGDLIFYRDPSSGLIWHVAIYLGNNMVIESWPPKIMVQPVTNWQRSWIAGVGRPFV